MPVISSKLSSIETTDNGIDIDSKMATSSDICGCRGTVTIRTLFPWAVAFGLFMLTALFYVDRYHLATIRDQRNTYVRQDDQIQLRQEQQQQQQRPNASASFWDYDWDDLAKNSSADEKRLIGTRTLILVRHGHYNSSTGKLTDLGREQALMTGRRLRTDNIPYSEIIYSTLDRANETAHIIRQCMIKNDIPLRSDALLVEGGPIPPKPTVPHYQMPAQMYIRDGPRMEAAFRKYFHRGDRNQTQQTFQILVGHGNLFRFFALRALQLPRDAWMRMYIPNASITTINIGPDGIVWMLKFGDAGHLPHDKITY